jgi:hypothetical protein
MGVKQSGHEAGYSPPHNTKVRNVWSHTSTFPICLYDFTWKSFPCLHSSKLRFCFLTSEMRAIQAGVHPEFFLFLGGGGGGDPVGRYFLCFILKILL